LFSWSVGSGRAANIRIKDRILLFVPKLVIDGFHGSVILHLDCGRYYVILRVVRINRGRNAQSNGVNASLQVH
jgi:hypothetical protein